jgi:hypothetical protein
VASRRRYVYRGPVGAAARRRGRDEHELIVRDEPGRYVQACELDGRGISRAAAAWVLGRWRRSRKGPGAGLWVTRYG